MPFPAPQVLSVLEAQSMACGGEKWFGKKKTGEVGLEL